MCLCDIEQMESACIGRAQVVWIILRPGIWVNVQVKICSLSFSSVHPTHLICLWSHTGVSVVSHCTYLADCPTLRQSCLCVSLHVSSPGVCVLALRTGLDNALSNKLKKVS